ncbi:DUF2834 domain-containing protein [Mycobacterium conspicuum]|uniref:DUF2834 domain-containing protein n=1 Tax=Mycobacterium conspicuum TaxID=44010 RepID=UPI000A15E334|nr:DUF2834 domain-containing protein [Mycobacterium conspicuum]ORV38754.1 hypothetical protein AWC00_00520 [Mycobacterium conspicuum]
MTTTGQPDSAAHSSTSRTLRCAVYGFIAVVALVATWGANLDYTFDGFMHNFMNDLRVTPASRSYAGDLVMLALAAVILMVVEARKHGVKFVWLYILGGFAVAISVTFPLFLIARELRMNPADTARLRTTDVILIGVVAVLVAGQIVWVDMV